MHQYKIEIYTLNETGTAVVKKIATRYADNPEQAERMMEEFTSQKQLDADGNETAIPMYKVNLYTIAYKQVTSPAQFFANFKA